MKRNSILLASLLLVTLIVVSALSGWFGHADQFLRDLRFSAFSQPVSGDVVFVDIDARTLEQVGVWPWPRHVHAELIDKLVAANTSDIVMDVDFSSASTPTEDQALADAFERAGGFVMLASFFQQDYAGGSMKLQRPLDMFAAQAEPVLVNVAVDRDGVVRRYPRGEMVDGRFLPSLASALAGQRGGAVGSFAIDYSFDAATVPHVSAMDVLNGTVDPMLLAGKKVLVGASALELRDNFATPRYGTLPGAMVQLLAAETLSNGRAIAEPGPRAVVLIVLLLALMLGLLVRRIRFINLVFVGIVTLVGVEFCAFMVQSTFAIALDTVAIHLVVAGLVLLALCDELGLTGLQLAQMSHEHDKTRDVLDRVIADNFDGVLVVDHYGYVLAASKLAEAVLGGIGSPENSAELVGQHISKLLPPTISHAVWVVLGHGGDDFVPMTGPQISELAVADKQLTIEYVVTRSEVHPTQKLRSDSEEQAEEAIACLTFRDISQRHKAAERLKYLAHHDPLTGALSLSRLQSILNERTENDDQRKQGVSIFMLDMTRFKAVNDTLGHSYGDEVLKQIVSRLKATSLDLVTRLGGDSFVLVRFGVLNSGDMDAFCRHMLDKLTDIYQIGEHQALLGARMGVTDSRVSGHDPEVLISHADLALSAAKDIPGNAYAHYLPEMDDALQEKQEMELALRSALARNELSVNYQPQVLLGTGEIVGVEALVRWNHPQLGIVSPARFIPVAEETGIILELGRWILNTACKEVMKWPRDITLAVNFSPMQFEFGDVIGDIEQALKASGLPAERLEVEITEGVVINNASGVIDILQHLRGLGAQIAIDDFGTGYSSLSYLGQLPVDKIKIDQSFVRGLPSDQESAAIIRAVMTLSDSLDKKVIAEGIENADQAWMLRLAGCPLGQGYHYGRPLVASEMEQRLVAPSETDSRKAG